MSLKKKKLLFVAAAVATFMAFAQITWMMMFTEKITLASTAAATVKQQRIFVLYLVSINDSFQTRRITEMKQVFKENFVVVWDNKNELECPFKHITTCVEFVSLSERKRLSDRCCGIEKALTWAVQNKEKFDHVWFMEDDTYYTDIAELEKVVATPSSIDFLHHDPFTRFDPTWYYYNQTILDTNGLYQVENMFHMLLNLYRVSNTMLTELEWTFEQLDNEWYNVEALFPTVAVNKNLTSALWAELQGKTQSKYKLLYRPCFLNTNFPAPGIYHPVKFRNGAFQSCV